MGWFRKEKIRYWLVMLGIIVLILIAFNTVFTLVIHKKLANVVDKPGRWPAGAYIYDEKIGFDFASGVSGPIGDGSFYVKSHEFGFRIGQNDDAVAYRPGGILSLGCSFTYGDEVESEQTFTQLTANGLGMAAYNYGICSFSYTHALLKAEKLKEQGILDQLKPRYVVLGCWSGLPERSRSPFPPLASDNLAMPAACMVKENGQVRIQYPMQMGNVFEMVNQYRKDGARLSIQKFMKLFLAAPGYMYLYFKNNRLSQAVKSKNLRKELPDLDVYEFYLSGIERVFSAYGSRIIVLYMPNRTDEQPDPSMMEAIGRHPGVIFVNGLQAIERYHVPNREYALRHPQPDAHRAYALEIINTVTGR